MLEYIKIAGSK